MFIYFEQGKCKKILFLSAVSCVVGSAQNVVSGQITVSGGTSCRQSHTLEKDSILGCFEIIRSEITNRKYQSVRVRIGYKSVDTLKFIRPSFEFT
jgi:hypothetical protein